LNTVLVLTADEALRGRIARSLSKFSTFEARSESEAYQTLRLVDIDVVLREGKGPAGALATFVAAAKDIAPRTLVVAIGDLPDDETGADFSVPEAFTARELDAVLRHALDRQRLIREVDAARGLVPLAPVTNGGEEPDWDGAALTRVLRGITGGLAAGFDLPRVLGMFLDAIAELVHPTRLAVLLPDPAGQE
jgi:hypothetical protein